MSSDLDTTRTPRQRELPFLGTAKREPVTPGYAWSVMLGLMDEARESLRGEHPLSFRAKNAVKVVHAVTHAMDVLRRA
jgi:hypothetical protein